MANHPNSAVDHDAERSPVTQPRSGGGCLFLIPLLLTLCLGLTLGVVALLLPPFNLYDRFFGVQYVGLNAQSNAAQTADGSFTFILHPDDSGQDFGVALDMLAIADFTETQSEAQLAQAANAIPNYLNLVSPVYTINTTGTPPNQSNVSIALPPNSSPDDTSLYGWSSVANRWEFLPSQSADNTVLAQLDDVPALLAIFRPLRSPEPTIIVSVDITQTLTPEIANLATFVTPGGIQPKLDGSLTGSLAAGIEQETSYPVYPVVRNFVDPRAIDVQTIQTILANPTLSQQHLAALETVAATYDGVFIDYRNIPTEQRAGFTLFVQALARSIHARGNKLGIVVPAATNVEGHWETGAYDWRELASASDFLQIDLTTIEPSMFAPGEDRLVEAMLRWAIGEVERQKILVGLSTLAQRQASGGFTPLTYGEALAGLGNVAVEGQFSATGEFLPGTVFTAQLDGLKAVAGEFTEAQTPYLDFLDENDNPVTRVWLTTDEALAYRLNHIAQFGIHGYTFTDILAGDLAEGIPNAIVNFRLGLPYEATRTEFKLRWTLETVGGVVNETVTNLNEPFVATVESPGNYAVNVAVVADTEIQRAGQAIAMAAPTATPTPLPSPTPRPTTTPTPTPNAEQIAAAQAQSTAYAGALSAPSGGGLSSAANAGGIAVGTFEYGGHVTSASSGRAIGAMQQAGMNWMKVQIRYSPGAGIDEAASEISAAQAAGFKILLGTVGSPQELAFAGDDYVRGYAEWLGAVAGLNPQAIEVWNEPNIDREWPRNQISGASYAGMLQQAYNAIKSRNAGVMVISGAPAPTGAEAAFPGQVVNDDRFLRELVGAGGLQYLDCVGMHYNEGIVPPTVISGDPRDNYYTRYYQTMVETYWNIIGGQKPICITELGYLTSEGYPSLPDFFAWASNVTLAQHAAWLADAAALSSQSNRIRLMIVWNVDFTSYGSDPQGGYAMVRPDGSCPACDKMAAAR